MIGVKLAHTHQSFRMDDPAYYSIYDVTASHRAPVYIHTGPSPFVGTNQEDPYINPNYMEEAISVHPNQFILGHLGFDFINRKQMWLDDCLRLAETYDNIWLEPSALGSATSDPERTILIGELIRRSGKKGLIDRVLYGSDGPQRPGFIAEYLERNIYAMEQSGYTVEEVRKVLSEKCRPCIWTRARCLVRGCSMNTVVLSIISMRMDVGYPWERLYLDWQVSDKVSFFGLYEQPSLKRIQPCAGMSLVWIDRAWDVSGELMIGSVVQNAQSVKKVHQQS